MQKILILSFSDLRSDPRVRRQIFALKDRYEITAVGLADPGISGVAYLEAQFSNVGLFTSFKSALALKMRCFERYYQEKYALPDLRNKLKNQHFDLIIANDIDALPFALSVTPMPRIFLDCHEYAPCEFEDQFLWRFFFKEFKEYLCRTYLKQCDAISTVCEGIADEYMRNFGVLPAVVTNAADYVEMSPAPVGRELVNLIHHGAAIPSRQIERMIRMMDFLDERFMLTLMLTKNDLAYYQKLKLQAENNPRIAFREPVHFSKIINEISRYDIGVYILEPNSFNNCYALPNKFFEFIQARLAIAIGPSPEMDRLVQAYDLGVVAEEFEPESLALRLNGLTHEKIEYFKRRSSQAAYELSSARNQKKIQEIVGSLLEDKVPARA